MDSNENSFVRASQLRQPSKIPSPGKGLSEISASANNARAASMMPPPDILSTKRKISASMEPISKRKTLVERAGETPRSNIAAPPSSRPINSSVKATTLAGTRNPSFASSVSSRTPSMSFRNVSGSSFSGSVGCGSRPPSAQSHYRSQTAMGYNRSISQASVPAARSASSLDSVSVESEKPALGNRKGTPPISVSTYQHSSKLYSSKLRVSHDNQMNYKSDWSSSVATSIAVRPQSLAAVRSLRDVSLSTAMKGLTIRPGSSPSEEGLKAPITPSQIPRSVTPFIQHTTPSKTPKRPVSPKKSAPFLTRDSNTQGIAWDTRGRLEDMESLYAELKDKMNGTTNERNGLEEAVGVYKARLLEHQFQAELVKQYGVIPQTCLRLTRLWVSAVNELETIRAQLTATNATLQSDLSATRSQLSTTAITLADEQRARGIEVEDLRRQHRYETEASRREARDEVEQLNKEHRETLDELERKRKREIEAECNSREQQVQEITTQMLQERRRAEAEMNIQEGNVRNVSGALQQLQNELDKEKSLNKSLRDNLSESTTNSLTLESSLRALRARIDYLESDSKAQSDSFAALQQQLQDAINNATEANDKLRQEETLRRKLHNQVQELKGNIRVFCRARPSLNSEPRQDAARIAFPDTDKDCREIEVQGPEEKSSLGNVTTKKNAFAFDRVFGPESRNSDVFDEISQLVQSALDGYNVCIFCYGQTGSGKTFTMSSDDGMIPRAVHQIYDTAGLLEEKGWKYTMEGSFVEVYNENLNDLLGKAEEFDKKKHEIRHDLQTSKTTITGINTVMLDSPAKVESILRRATANRSVAATKANERSSRSHSVFILKLLGENSITGEKSEGTLNLVDLAGSERLSHSGSTGERLKETQNINRSLSCLADVIGALGQGKEGAHVPYRNSKLTYLLQFSLGGNSKTLMFVNISPLQAHLSETLTSLRFATKVHNTHIGTAKRQAKVRDS
ncbi:MAG: kinesin-like nuclear fusion protein [Candelina submexicana]|nr:MAG: kinesin-like nuclear fusion protein [Candelina submexicana]